MGYEWDVEYEHVINQNVVRHTSAGSPTLAQTYNGGV